MLNREVLSELRPALERVVQDRMKVYLEVVRRAGGSIKENLGCLDYTPYHMRDFLDGLHKRSEPKEELFEEYTNIVSVYLASFEFAWDPKMGSNVSEDQVRLILERTKGQGIVFVATRDDDEGYGFLGELALALVSHRKVLRIPLLPGLDLADQTPENLSDLWEKLWAV